MEAWRKTAGKSIKALGLTSEERFVAPTVQARALYIQFATLAACFFKGEKPCSFTGKHWKL